MAGATLQKSDRSSVTNDNIGIVDKVTEVENKAQRMIDVQACCESHLGDIDSRQCSVESGWLYIKVTQPKISTLTEREAL